MLVRDPPIVAVVVPVFRRPTSVVEALESIAAQTRAPDVLVVVDDGSGDDTPARVLSWIDARAPGFPVRLVSQENRGVSAARNRGLDEAGPADWVAFLDSDDLWPSGYLAAHLEVLRVRPDAVASTCDKDSTDVLAGRSRRVRRDWVVKRTTREILRRGPPGVSNSVLRCADVCALGGFDEGLRTAEDLDLMLRLSLRGPWVHVAQTSASYRHRLGEARGEAGALGHQHGDRRRTRAEVLERFLELVASERPALVGEARGATARGWARAGRQLRGDGRPAEAAECFARALALRPWDLRARWAAWRLRRRQGEAARSAARHTARPR